MSLAFGGCQLLLSQMPNLESAWWSSIIGAAMSFMYSSCALGLGASKGGWMLLVRHLKWGAGLASAGQCSVGGVTSFVRTSR